VPEFILTAVCNRTGPVCKPSAISLQPKQKAES
jgi:hypothetical protein